MSELSKEYRKILDEIDNRITNKEDLEFVKNKISEISVIFIDIIDRMSDVIEERIGDIEQSQRNVEERLESVQSVISSMEQDMYNEDCDIEITCPYCNNDFVTELNDDVENEIECPECHNIIELDLNANIDDDIDSYNIGCHGGCRKMWRLRS